MTATYRPKIRNGHISRRPVKGTFAARAGWMPKSRRPQAVWILVVIGAVIAGGFVAGLRWQLQAHYTSRAEVRLKSALSQAESEQRFLEAQQFGALTPREVERTASKRRVGVVPVALDEPSALRIPYQMAAQQVRDRERERKEKARDVSRAAAAARENRATPATLTVRPPQ
ncbi:MAG: hypothetical protein ABI882_00720 [Acidobacteriota bacterium]